MLEDGTQIIDKVDELVIHVLGSNFEWDCEPFGLGEKCAFACRNGLQCLATLAFSKGIQEEYGLQNWHGNGGIFGGQTRIDADEAPHMDELSNSIHVAKPWEYGLSGSSCY